MCPQTAFTFSAIPLSQRSSRSSSQYGGSTTASTNSQGSYYLWQQSP